ncbi:outer membrane protein assembly factor BamB [Marinospirillum alkaliphilum]|uniref:Outer membrane protein assembly factor BamB n=1 Tax=Marinospirillum alkaliphilum DSM 21637 TaxID=1122209 RepID=A0A1K1UXE2_9GAMM|nr:outer membrane protein assembly factor BamB [Marinospirillum alkaliphilum]SFX17472.1 Beta-barrel assembly machine subunit BamB [Marinospirillum alkaliphilum DSM 21637]
MRNTLSGLRYLKYPVAACLLALLAACSSLPEPQYPPAPLPAHSGEDRLTSVWRDHSGYGERWRGYQLLPALRGNLLVTADAQGLLQAFDLSRTGFLQSDLLWMKDLEVGVSAGLALHDNHLYVATQNGELLSLDISNGNELWRVRLSSEALSPPQADGNLLVVHTADGKLAGFDRSNGRQLWLHDSLIPLLTLRGTAAPTVTSLQTFAGFANGKLVAVDNRTGQARWEARVAQPRGRTDIERLVDINGQARLAQGMLIVNSFQGQTQALDPFSGRARWSRDLSSYHAAAIHDGKVFVVDEASRIHALDLLSGSSLWQQDKLYGRSLTEPVILSGRLVVADYQGYLHLLDPDSGKLTGRRSFDLDGIRATPVIDDNRLLVHSIRGRLGLFTLKN